MTSLRILLLVLLACCSSDSKDKKGAVTATTTPPEKPVTDTAEPQQTLGLKNGVVHNGVLLGGQPTDEQIRAAKDSGFATIITLRTSDEPGFDDERELVESLGMKWVSIPVHGKDGLTVENAEAFAMATEGESVLAHCASGNRIGALIAIKAKLDGRTASEALGLGKKTGLTGLETAVKDMLDSMEK